MQIFVLFTLDRKLSLGCLIGSDFEFLLYNFVQIAMMAYQTDSLITITLWSILHDYQGTIHLEFNSLVRIPVTNNESHKAPFTCPGFTASETGELDIFYDDQ